MSEVALRLGENSALEHLRFTLTELPSIGVCVNACHIFGTKLRFGQMFQLTFGQMFQWCSLRPVPGQVRDLALIHLLAGVDCIVLNPKPQTPNS